MKVFLSKHGKAVIVIVAVLACLCIIGAVVGITRLGGCTRREKGDENEPHAETVTTSDTAPEAALETTSDKTSDTASETATDRTSESAPETTANRTSESAPETTPDKTSETTSKATDTETAQNTSGSNQTTVYAGSGGALSVRGTDLVDSSGNPIQLKGVSTMGLQWYGQYVNYEAFKTLRDDWGANLIRLALYTHEGGYCSGGNQTTLMNLVDQGVEYATELGMYVIVDWHVLNEQSPAVYEDQAKTFFQTVAKKYAGHDNVIYEICNEPNNTSWDVVKSYAETIIPIIRQYDEDAVILVGTPTWSQLDDSRLLNNQNPLACDTHNVMYVCHFYAATHKDDLRNKVKTAIGNGLPVFISEFSICDASGNGGIDYTSADAWKNLINSYNLSYAGWSLCNKSETSALISSSCNKTSGWATSELSDTGRYLRTMISNGAPDYAGTPVADSSSSSGSEENSSGEGNSGNTSGSSQSTAAENFQFEIKITNQSGATVNPWQVSVEVPAGCSYINGWNASYEISGTTLIITPESYNGELAQGASASVGLQLNCPSAMTSFTVESNGLTVEFTLSNSW